MSTIPIFYVTSQSKFRLKGEYGHPPVDYVAGICKLLYMGIPHTSFDAFAQQLACELDTDSTTVRLALERLCERYDK